MGIKEIVSEIIKNKREQGGIDSVYFIACGGSYAGFFPAKYLIDRESRKLKTAMYTSNEFVHAVPKSCGKNTIAVVCSMRGTKETCEAARVAKETGATTVAFYVQESHMTEISDYKIKYESIALDESLVQNVNSSMELNFAFELLHQLEDYEYYEDAMDGFEIVDDIYRKAVKYCTPRAVKFAKECKNDETIYVIGGGPSMGSAYIFSICNLMEMQWVHSPTVNTGELLHGPFEAIDKNVPIVFLLSEGRTRPVDMRALKFLKTYGERLFIIDAKELQINRISDNVSEFFNHLIFSSILNNVYLRELSYSKKHNYLNRRYMWKVEY
ncbi:sugar isomerase [Clostridium neuense]|uniref:Sugar isomerase n=1 Tax=Clostridium neuense TaxID=1728934 RepID=A0ABW8TN07_9CLOT